jgi:ketosteroid isomerase-like protein
MDEHADQMARARRGLAAWRRGDVAALADILDPNVELLWWTPGDWDCHGKDQVVALLTERLDAEPPAEVDIEEIDDSTVLVERRHTVLDGPEAGFRPATVVRFENGRVVRMKQYRSHQDAIAGVMDEGTR